MPYSGPDDPKLPANVKSLPADKRSQWIQIWNRSFAACMKGGGGNCEQISFRNANGVVLSDMMTRDLEGVEVLREGTWNGVPFPIERLDQMVEAHKALRGILDPPIKLGHDDNQRLLQKDGYSAAGWVENLRRVGSRLVADLKQVPAMVADLIEVGAIRKRSSEVRFQLMAGGQTWPAVLTGLALLGEQLPAVDSLSDMAGLYKALELEIEEGVTPIPGELGGSLDEESIRVDLRHLQDAQGVASGQKASMLHSLQVRAREAGGESRLPP